MPNPTTNNWSLSIQRDIGKGMVLDVAYVGNNAHHQQGLAENLNPIQPGTVWSPGQSGINSAGLPLGTLNPKFVNPNQPSQLLPIDLIRSMIGYAGIGEVTKFTALGESYYNALQVRLEQRRSQRYPHREPFARLSRPGCADRGPNHVSHHRDCETIV